MPITEMTRDEVRKLRDLVTRILNANIPDLNVEVGNARYTRKDVTFKVTFALQGHDPYEEEFRQFAGAYGLSPDDFGRRLTISGRTYEICGVSPRSPKYPILAKRVGTDSTYKFTTAQVLRAMEKTNA